MSKEQERWKYIGSMTDGNGKGREDFRVILKAGMRTAAAQPLAHNLNIWVEFVSSYVDRRRPFQLNSHTYYTIRSGLPPYISPKTIEENSRMFSA